jgi:DNA repair exonuclease SbcCD nuclease subunit
MKILVFSDIHIHPHKKSSERLEHCLAALEWVFATAERKGISNLVFLGDLFHDRQRIDVLTYQRTFEIFERNLRKTMDVRLLLGNHDLWHLERLDVSSVNPLRSIPGVTVVDKPCVQDISDGNEHFYMAFLPYTHDPIEDVRLIEEEWNKKVPKGRPRVLGGHISVDGAVWNVRHNTLSEVSVEHDGDMVRVGPEIFRRWDRVFLGHYHAPQKLSDNVEYVGSPLQLSFGEAFQDKHIIIFDTDEDKIEYIDNDFSPKHYIISEEEIEKYPLEGNFVRLEVEDITNKSMSDMRQKLVEQSNVSTLEIKQSRRKDEHVVTDAKSILYREEEMLQRYVDQVNPEGLDKEFLLKIGMGICDGENA